MDMLSLPAPADTEERDAAGRRLRRDGWTAARQRTFLEAIAEGFTVDEACRLVGLSPASAYAFRRRAAGAAFAAGWNAANLLARERLTATLYARAIDGFTETVTRPDGTTFERHRFDNRLGLHMLRRLDGQAEAAAGAEAAAARLIAQEFDAFLATLDQGPARAGLFLAVRADSAADLGPVAALARADRFLHSGAALPAEVDVSDLDPAARAGWTADQWRRAEAAGLVGLAPAPAPAEPAEIAQEGQFHQFEPELAPVWYDADDGCFYTDLPPPEDFIGHEDHEWGDDGYYRTLTDEEEAAAQAEWLRDYGAPPLSTRAEAEARRTEWLAAAFQCDPCASGVSAIDEKEGFTRRRGGAEAAQTTGGSPSEEQPDTRSRGDDGARPDASDAPLRASAPPREPTSSPFPAPEEEVRAETRRRREAGAADLSQSDPCASGVSASDEKEGFTRRRGGAEEAQTTGDSPFEEQRDSRSRGDEGARPDASDAPLRASAPPREPPPSFAPDPNQPDPPPLRVSASPREPTSSPCPPDRRQRAA